MTFQPPQGSPDADITNSLQMRQIGATVSPKDVAEATKPYGLDKTPVAGKSDAQLRKMAVDAVIKWWKQQKTAATASSKPSATAKPSSTTARASGTSSAGAQRATTSSSSTGGLPNTATGSGGSAVARPLAHILTAAERRAQEAAVAAQELALKQQRAREAAALAVQKQRDAMLQAAGLFNVTVPTYALTSTANLQAWITQQLIARRRRAAGTGFRN